MKRPKSGKTVLDTIESELVDQKQQAQDRIEAEEKRKAEREAVRQYDRVFVRHSMNS